MCHNTTVQNVSWRMHQPPPCCECATWEHTSRQPSCFCHTRLYTSSIKYLKVKIIPFTKVSVNQPLLLWFSDWSFVIFCLQYVWNSHRYKTPFFSIHIQIMCTHQLYSLLCTAHYLLFKCTWCGQFLFTVRKTKFAHSHAPNTVDCFALSDPTH